MQEHEHVLVFTKNGERVNYYPIKEKRDKPIKSKGASTKSGSSPIAYLNNINKTYVDRYPTSIKRFQRDNNKIHPTQKPVALFKYLIKTYTNEGDLVLDNCMGSGTTGVACKNLNRNFIGIELDPEYFKIAEKRINENL